VRSLSPTIPPSDKKLRTYTRLSNARSRDPSLGSRPLRFLKQRSGFHPFVTLVFVSGRALSLTVLAKVVEYQAGNSRMQLKNATTGEGSSQVPRNYG
jgi:hypothetical protein